MNWVLVGVVAYIAAQIGIGVIVSRKIASQDDYLLAGRQLGYWLASFSIFATWFGAETCVGAAGQVYAEGLTGNTTEPYAYGLTLLLAGLLFAVPIWKRKFTTLADLFRERFSPGVERVAAILLIPTSVCWAAAQIRAFGHVLTTASQLDFQLSVGLAAAVVIVYTTYGGLLADAITDVVQGIALIIGLVVLLVAVVSELGGVEATFRAIDTHRAYAEIATEAHWLATVEAWAMPILGSIVAQELVVRMSAARSPQVAKRSALIAGFSYILVGSIPVFIGLAGPALIDSIDDREQILPLLAQRHLSTFGYTLFAGALISAILSTVDSTLLVASSLFSHNLVLRALPNTSERGKVRLARAGVVGFGVIAYFLAVSSDSVGALIAQANGFGSAGVFVVVVFGLFTRVGGRVSAYATLATGALVYFAALTAEYEYAYLASLVAALAVYLLAAVSAPPSRGKTSPRPS